MKIVTDFADTYFEANELHYTVLFFAYAIKYETCQDDIVAIIKQNNKTAKENFLLKKRFNLLTAEDLRPKG